MAHAGSTWATVRFPSRTTFTSRTKTFQPPVPLVPSARRTVSATWFLRARKPVSRSATAFGTTPTPTVGRIRAKTASTTSNSCSVAADRQLPRQRPTPTANTISRPTSSPRKPPARRCTPICFWPVPTPSPLPTGRHRWPGWVCRRRVLPERICRTIQTPHSSVAWPRFPSHCLRSAERIIRSMSVTAYRHLVRSAATSMSIRTTTAAGPAKHRSPVSPSHCSAWSPA